MPAYTYTCDHCRETGERNVRIADRDAQLCTCGGLLRRIFDPSAALSIRIPEGFRATNGGILPEDPVQAATWEREGVRPVGKRWI